MKYELDVLAALTRLSTPNTQEIVVATGISERKVQSVIRVLQSELNVGIKKIKKGRKIHYKITDWGVFESGVFLKKILKNRQLREGITDKVTIKMIAFYNSVKTKNYEESTRLEGMSINFSFTSNSKESIEKRKLTLIKKYSKHKDTRKNHA